MTKNPSITNRGFTSVSKVYSTTHFTLLHKVHYVFKTNIKFGPLWVPKHLGFLGAFGDTFLGRDKMQDTKIEV